MSDEEGSVEYGLVMPFVVCKSKGGPYDDTSFVAGWECGVIDLALKFIAPLGGTLERYVHPESMPQIDLIAMQHGYSTEVEPWSDDWSLVRFAFSGASEGGAE